MYLLLFFTLVIAFSEAKQPYILLPEKFISLMLEKSPGCMAASGAHSGAIHQFLTIPLEDNDAGKRYNYCLFKSMGLSDDDGHFYVDRVLALYDKSDQREKWRVGQTSAQCNQIVAENPIETMYQVLQCFSYRAPAWIPH